MWMVGRVGVMWNSVILTVFDGQRADPAFVTPFSV